MSDLPVEELEKIRDAAYDAYAAAWDTHAAADDAYTAAGVAAAAAWGVYTTARAAARAADAAAAYIKTLNKEEL